MAYDPMTGPAATRLNDPRSITDFSDFLDSMAHDAREYVSAERAYISLLLAKRAADASRSLLGLVIGALLALVVLVFGSVAAAMAIGRAMNDPVSGYLIVTGIWAVLLAAFVLLWRGSLGDRFRLSIINMLHGN